MKTGLEISGAEMTFNRARVGHSVTRRNPPCVRGAAEKRGLPLFWCSCWDSAIHLGGRSTRF